MIPPPKLDDRTFDDIVAEAVRLIPRYAPEWTNHNPSDPGITLIELAAWMTDIILYRLNQVPDKNYVAFLNLLGIKLKPPRAAQALLTFTLVEGADRADASARHRRSSTPQATEEDTVTFETARDLVVTSVKLDRCFSYFERDLHRELAAHPSAGLEGGFEVFAGAAAHRALPLPRRIRASRTSARRRCCASTSAPPSTAAATSRACSSGSTGTGTRWKELKAAPIEVDRGEVAFLGPAALRAVRPSTTSRTCGCAAASPRCRRARGDRDRHDPRARRGGRRRRAARAGARQPRQQRVHRPRSRQEHLAVRQGAEGRLLPVPRVRRAVADRRTRTSRSRCSSPTSVGRADRRAVRAARARVGVLGRQALAATSAGRPARRAAPAPATSSASTTRPGAARQVAAWCRSAAPRTCSSARSTATRATGSASASRRATTASTGTYTLENDKWVFKDDTPAAPAGAAQRHLPVSRGLSRRAPRRSRSTTSSTRDVTEVARTEFTIFQPFDAGARRVAGAVPRLRRQAAERAARALLPARRGARPRLAVTAEAEIATRAREVRDVRGCVGERPARRLGVLGRREWEPLSSTTPARASRARASSIFVAPDDWAPLEQVHRGALLAARAARAGRLRQAAAHRA